MSEPAERLAELWHQGQRPDVRAFLAATGALPLPEVVAVLRVDQHHRWRHGKRVPAEEYLGQFPQLLADPERALEVVYGEFLLREGLSEGPTLEEYQRRFPQFAERLRQQAEVHQALEAEDLLRSWGPPTEPRPETVPDVSKVWPAVPGYEILGELGRGGMGVVYKARQLSLKRVVALKMILAGPHAGPEELARFRAEAEAVALFQHPHIVQIHEVGEYDGLPFFSLEFCAGGSLHDRIQGKPQPPRQTAELLAVLADTIHYAHQRGIIHRDLKPANVLLVEGGGWRVEGEENSPSTPKVTDFGLAKKLDRSANPTASGALVGTPSYMPPEQARGQTRDVGPAADVWALGAILYEMLTGRPPFLADTPLNTVLQVLQAEPVPPSRLQPKLPRDLETIALKCLQKEPRHRYASALALAEDLRRFLAGKPIHARPASVWERAGKLARRHPAVTALIGLVVLVTALGFGGVTWKWLDEAAQRLRAEQAERDERQAKEAAQQARDGERQAKEAEQAAHAKTETALGKAQTNLYLAGIYLAQRDWMANDLVRAEAVLDDYCAVPARRWEWGYLKRQCRPEVLTIRKHAGLVNGVAFSPDGKRLVSGGVSDGPPRLKAYESGLKVWDAVTGQELLSLGGYDDEVSSVTFSPDGRHIISASGVQGALQMWDAATGKKLRVLARHGETVSAVAFSPDGKRLASANGSWFSTTPGEVKLWDAGSGEKVLTLPAHKWGVRGVAFSPDGNRLASAGNDGLVKVWDLSAEKEVFTLSLGAEDLNPRRVCAVAFSPRGDRLVLGVEAPLWTNGTAEVKIWNLSDAARGKTTVLTIPAHMGGVTAVAFHPSGKQIASAGEDKLVKLWDVVSGKEVFALRGHVAKISSLAFTRDGTRLATAAAYFHPYHEPYRPGEIKVWDVTTPPEARLLRASPGEFVKFSPDGNLVALAGDTAVHLWDVATGEKVAKLPGPREKVLAVAFSPDGKLLACANGDPSGDVKLRDPRTGEEALTLRGHRGPVAAVAFSPDGRRLATGGSDRTVKVWDAAGGEALLTLPEHVAPVTSVAFSPDGCRLASASGEELSEESDLKVWDAVTGQVIVTLRGHTGKVSCVAFSPKGDRLASTGYDGSLRFWDSADGKEMIAIRKGHTRFYGVAFSPDGDRVASAEGEVGKEAGAAKVWDAATGRELLSLHGINNSVTGVAFSPDRLRLATAERGAGVKIWNAAPP